MTMASRYLLLHHGQRLSSRADRHNFDIASAQASRQSMRRCLLRGHHQQLPHAPFEDILDGIEGRIQVILGDRFFEICHSAQGEASAAVFVAGNDMHRDMARRRVVLQAVEDRPAGHVGQSRCPG